MKVEIKCQNCNIENIIIDNKLFFSEEPKDTKVFCSICNSEMATLKTDGWFFVQSNEQYEIDQKIEKQKDNLKCTELDY